MGGAVVSRLVVLVGGTLYPAYASYKAVKSANVRQYVRWMMYWVVFALFITAETFTDLLLSWLPFYYEIKVGFIIWLLSPYTKGAAFLYRKFIHPALSKREPEIDRFLHSARERSYATMVDVGSRGINVAANAVVTAAVKGQAVVSERLKSFSVNDLSRLSDDTPIHMMNPASYNPPIQHEVLRRTEAPPRFEPSAPIIHLPQQYPTQDGMGLDMQMITDNAGTGFGIAAMTRTSALPPSGSLSPPRDQISHHAMMPSSGDHQYNLGLQYKATSMMNLSQSSEHSHSVMSRRIEYTTSSAPPETTVDDSVLPDHTENNSSEPSYSTLPRQRKKKHKKEVDPTQVRRSKRRTAKSHQQYYEYSDDEREQE